MGLRAECTVALNQGLKPESLPLDWPYEGEAVRVMYRMQKEAANLTEEAP